MQKVALILVLTMPQANFIEIRGSQTWVFMSCISVKMEDMRIHFSKSKGEYETLNSTSFVSNLTHARICRSLCPRESFVLY